jgi:hypothetical protein
VEVVVIFRTTFEDDEDENLNLDVQRSRFTWKEISENYVSYCLHYSVHSVLLI